MKLILFILGCFLVGGCQVKTTLKDVDYSGMDSILFISGVKSLYMDDTDYPTSGHIRYYEGGSKSYLVQGNESQKMIRVYDYTSGKKLQTVDVDMRDGEFFAYNLDTAFVISKGKSNVRILTWNKGEKATITVSVTVKKHQVEQYPRCRLNGASFAGGKWFFPCYRIGEYPAEMMTGKERFPLLAVDLETNSYEYVGAYPEVYASNNMGTLNYWVPEICRGLNNGSVVVGFRASSEIMIYSPETKEMRFESVKSVYADTIPLPLTEKGRNYFNEQDSYYYYAQYSHYGAMSYDPWKKVYYRFVGIGLNDWDLKPSPYLQEQKKWSVMVFDTNFRKLGEQYLGDLYNVNYHFVSPDGLFVLNNDKNEDVANYTLLKYIKE